MEAQRSSENLVSIKRHAVTSQKALNAIRNSDLIKKMEVFPRQEKKNTKEGIEGMAKLNLTK